MSLFHTCKSTKDGSAARVDDTSPPTHTHKITFTHSWFSTLFFSMKMAESLGIVLVSNIIDIDDMQVSTRTVFLNLNTCKVMIFFKFWPENSSRLSLLCRYWDSSWTVLVKLELAYLWNQQCSLPRQFSLILPSSLKLIVWKSDFCGRKINTYFQPITLRISDSMWSLQQNWIQRNIARLSCSNVKMLEFWFSSQCSS